jgi:hypothetical protein
MLRVTQDIFELRHWAEARGGHPCRDAATGRLGFHFAGEPCRAIEVGWDEFEPAFCVGRCVCVCDDAPGATTWFIGTEDEAKQYLCGSPAWGAGAAHP